MNRKRVSIYDVSYDSTSKAASALNLSRNTVRRRLNDVRQTNYRFVLSEKTPTTLHPMNDDKKKTRLEFIRFRY